MTDPRDLVCVYNATNSAMAEIVRNLLEGEGIRAATGDTHNPFPGLSIAPAEVFVERSNEVAARSIIANAAKEHLSEFDDELDGDAEIAVDESGK